MNNIFLIGFMGAGKSSVAAGLGTLLKLPVVEMDQYISENEKMTIPEIFEKKGEPYFRKCETDLLKSCCTEEARIISCGGGVAMRQENVDVMHSCGTVILLTATPEVILERVKDNNDRPLLQNKKNVKDIEALMEQRRPKYEAAADITIDTSELDVKQVCQSILKKIWNAA